MSWQRRVAVSVKIFTIAEVFQKLQNMSIFLFARGLGYLINAVWLQQSP